MSETFQLRYQFTRESVKTYVSSGADIDQKKQILEKLRFTVGEKLLDRQWSRTHSEAIVTLRGNLRDIMTIQQVLRRSGAYRKITHEIVVPMDFLKEKQPAVEAASRAFVSPDQDEIDRMLLEG